MNLEALLLLSKKYNRPVPRYTSYPTALDWHSAQSHTKSIDEIYLSTLPQMQEDKLISVYLHIPFCKNRCLYCGCNVTISRRDEITDRYLDSLIQEINIKTDKIPFRAKVHQLHFGGGTPNYLSQRHWEKLIPVLNDKFDLSSECEMSIEMDPMECDSNYISAMKKYGFNRVSYGIQDVNAKTLKAVDRPQALLHLNHVLESTKRAGFNSINYDFIYGLPYQTIETYRQNLQWIRYFRPDRIALFSYAHVPWIKKHQLKMPVSDLLDGDAKTELYFFVREELLSEGYVQVGMDHFALPNDELVKKLKVHKLGRNFMGYTTIRDLDMIAFGSSSIAKTQNVFAQSYASLKSYTNSIETKSNYFEKVYKMTKEDILRASIIEDIMTNFYLDVNSLEKKFNISFNEHFDVELAKIKYYENEGLLKLQDRKITISEEGKFVIREIASTFDAFRIKGSKTAFSKGI